MDVIDLIRRQGIQPARLAIDSRRVEPGDVFLAYPGAHADGRDFIRQAIERGAAAVVAERGVKVSPGGTAVPLIEVDHLAILAGEIAHLVYGKPSEQLWLAGVTGTNGKTSVTQWIAQAMNALDDLPPDRSKAGRAFDAESPGDEPGSPLSPGKGMGTRHRRCAVIGTLGNGFPGALVESPNTTPDAVGLHRDLAAFVCAGAVACAMEVSSIGLDQSRVAGAQFDVAVFTNLTRDHLEYHGSMEAYAAAKARLFALPGLTAAVLNLDDPFGRELAASLAGRIATTGYTMRGATGADRVIAAERIEMTPAGVAYAVDGVRFAAPLVGGFNVANLLAVTGALLAGEESLEDIAAVLRHVTPPPGRMQTVGGIGEPLLLIDYAHTPDALEKALGAARDAARARGGRLICLFGCGGDRDPGKRPQMGAVAERLADRVLLTSDNPRGEAPAEIIAAIADGMVAAAEREVDRGRAIARAVREADDDDVVLIAGKGHEPYQEIAGRRLPFSDLEAGKSALAGRRS